MYQMVFVSPFLIPTSQKPVKEVIASPQKFHDAIRHNTDPADTSANSKRPI